MLFIFPGDNSASGGAAAMTSKGLKRKLKESSSSVGSNNKFESDSLSLSETAEDEDSKKKKVRTTFTGRQIFELEKMFETKKYLSSSERADMAKLLNVTEQQVIFSHFYPFSFFFLSFFLSLHLFTFINRRLINFLRFCKMNRTFDITSDADFLLKYDVTRICKIIFLTKMWLKTKHENSLMNFQ